jgi:DNA-binding PadR family transcriptional regulator
MPIQHAVLALLAEGDSYGYELRAQFQAAIGPQWGELNIGHLYQVLERLVRDGLVSKRAVRQPVRPDKVVYRLAPAGRTELERWLETPFVRQSGYRDDFFLKLLAASRLGQEALDTVLRVQREAYLAELRSLGDARKAHKTEPLVSLLVEAAIKHTEANLRVVELAERKATELVVGAAAATAAESPVAAKQARASRR